MRIKTFLTSVFMYIFFRFRISNIFIIIAYGTVLSSINFYADLFAQEKQINSFPKPIFEHLSVADGLPNNNVHSMLQDHLGYLWFGTQNSIARYDGYKIKVYEDSAKYPIARRIFEDKSGTLWIGSSKYGLINFNRISGKFTMYTHNGNDSSSIIANDIACINQDKDGNILVGTLKGLNLFNTKSKKFKRIYYQTSIYPRSVYKYLIGLKAKKKTISSILHVGNNASISKRFTINKKTIVLVIMMGEEGCDYGWLENEKGKIIVEPQNKELVYAGGYPGNQIQVIIDTLDRGRYRLNYTSDYGWSYNSWVVKEFGLPGEREPDFPGFWGIQVIDIGNVETNVERVLKNKKSVFREYIVDDIIKDRITGRIYIGIGNKMFIYDNVKNFFSQNNNIVEKEVEFGRINNLYQAKDGTIWIGQSHGLSKFNSLQNKFELYQPIHSHYYHNSENNIGQIVEDNNDLIWSTIYFTGGLICFDPQKEQFRRYKHDPENPGSLSSDQVFSLYKDRTGIIWVGTYGGGVNKWDSRSSKFKRFNHITKDPEGKHFNTIYALSEDNEGIIWFGTDDGLYSFNRSTNEFRNYKYNTNNGSNLIDHICIDSSGTIWISNSTSGLGKFNRSNGTFQFYSYDPNDSTTISNNLVKFILPDKNDFLWVGTRAGLDRFDIRKNRFAHYTFDSEIQRMFSFSTISAYIDKKEILWIEGGCGNLYKFNPKNGKLKSFNVTGNKCTDISAISEDKKGNFWIGTYGNGIYLFEKDKDVSEYNITESNGLAQNRVLSILEDNSDNLWIGTVNGLSKFDPESKKIKNYYISGRFGNTYIHNSTLKTPSGDMLFGTKEGFIMFNPGSITDDSIPPQVVINNISLFNRPNTKLTDGYIPEMHELDLSYNQNDLRFDFTGIHFSEPLKNKYKYMLENFDNDWVNAGTQRNATYTNLDPGEYVFKVLSCNSDGIWSKKAASIRIIISHPYWATWWAYLVYFLFGVVLLFYLRKYELKRAELKNLVKLDEAILKEREETDKMKSRFFANISHEFRTPLTLILGPAEKIISKVTDKNIIKDASIIKRNSNRLLQLVNQLLDLSKIEAGKLKLEATKSNIVSFIKGIVLSFESLSEEKDITLKILSENEYIEVYFDKEKMIKILTNILSNAFKFTPQDGKITVSIKECHAELDSASSSKRKIPGQARNDNVKDNVEIKIKDTGIGIMKEEIPKLFNRFYQVDSSFTKEYEGTGIGLALTKELVELHHGSIFVESELGQFTEFTIILPMGKEHLKEEDILINEKSEKTEINVKEDKYFLFKNINDKSINDPDINTSKEDKTIILIVEDNYDMREYIKESLDGNYVVEEAINGEQGIRKAVKIIPDLIISDMMMPKMDGNEMTRILKNDEKTSHIPIIILTAKSDHENKLEGLQTGADDYLTKPFDIKELQIRIENLINIRKKLQEKYSRIENKATQNSGKKLSSIDEKFIAKVMDIIEIHISEEEYDIEDFCSEVAMSRTQLHRKLKALTGKSASIYIRSVKLAKAKKLIEKGEGNISEIAYSVGFSSPAYFTKCFKEEFGYPPSAIV